MAQQQLTGSDLQMLSEAVAKWFEYYEVESDERVSRTLCDAAVELYRNGFRRIEDIAMALIGTYVGPWSAKVNAPTSAAIH